MPKELLFVAIAVIGFLSMLYGITCNSEKKVRFILSLIVAGGCVAVMFFNLLYSSL